eukprot:9330351-Pyramimonas_sp.AAC.1
MGWWGYAKRKELHPCMDWLCTLLANNIQHCGPPPATITADTFREGRFLRPTYCLPIARHH